MIVKHTRVWWAMYLYDVKPRRREKMSQSYVLLPDIATLNVCELGTSSKSQLVAHLWHVSVIFSDEIACSDPDFCEEICDNPSGCSDIAYPLLVLRIMPIGKTYMSL